MSKSGIEDDDNEIDEHMFDTNKMQLRAQEFKNLDKQIKMLARRIEEKKRNEELKKET